jgi:serine/threonine protein kinase
MWKDHAFRHGDVVRHPTTGAAFRVLELIGRGSYAEVYRAERVETGAPFALKVLQLHREMSAKTRERHRREGELLLRLNHPNLVHVHAIIESAEGRIVVVMDLLVGRTLAQLRTDCGGRLLIHTALEIGLQVCSALEALHEVKVVHRDIKPDNIFVGADALVRLCDLGVSQIPNDARITTEDTTIGTVEYMSPEQLYLPKSIGPRSDLFSLGTVLYEAIVGMSPFAVEGEMAPNVQELGMQIILRPHTPLRVAAPDVPEHLGAIVESLLAKAPGDRKESAAATYDLLEQSLTQYLIELRERNVEPPRISFVGRLPPVAPIDTDQLPLPPGERNPFVSVSMPPQEPANDAAKRAAPGPPAVARTEDMPAGALARGGARTLDLPLPIHLAPKAALPVAVRRLATTLKMGSSVPGGGAVTHVPGLASTVKMPAAAAAAMQAPAAPVVLPPVVTASPVLPAAATSAGDPPAELEEGVTQEMPVLRRPGRPETSSTPAVILPARAPLTQAEDGPARSKLATDPSSQSDTASRTAVVPVPARAPERPAPAAPARIQARRPLGTVTVAGAVVVLLAAAGAAVLWPVATADVAVSRAASASPEPGPVPPPSARPPPSAAAMPSAEAPPSAATAPQRPAPTPAPPAPGTAMPTGGAARGGTTASPTTKRPQGTPPKDAPPAVPPPAAAPTQNPHRMFDTQN